MGTSLNAYLKSIKDKPFKWGEHDCLTFSNTAWHVMYGHGWADDWLGRYMDGQRVKRRDEIKAEYGRSNFIDAVDERLTRYNGIPPRGALIYTKSARRWVTGGALGISVGSHGAFLSETSVLYLPIDVTDKAWVE